MPTATTDQSLKHFICIVMAAAAVTASTANLRADVTNVKEALDLAMKHEAVSAAGKKIKLYSLSAHYHGKKKRWNFQFFNVGPNLHNVTVTNSGKARHDLQSKGNRSIFKHLDFSQLPPPNEVLVEGLMERGMAAISALKFKPASNGNFYMNYQLRNNLRAKDKAYHSWSVTIPIADGKRGKTVTFIDGQIDAVTNAIIHGG